MRHDPIIRVKDVSYWYPDASAPALDSVDLTVGRGEFVLLVGASGSGKSTLLRALNGLVPKYHGGRFLGRVEVDGLDASQGPSVDMAAKVGLVFQDPERQSVMSRVDNEVAFGLECLGTPSYAIWGKVRDALDSVDLLERAADMVSELSSGQAQRLALADVLAMEPKVLALDEPTSQLDPAAAEEFLQYLDKVRTEGGVTVLLAEHRLDRGIQLADRVVVLHDGRIVFDGTPLEYLNNGFGADETVPMTVLGEVFRDARPVPLGPEEAGERIRHLLSQGRLGLERVRDDSPGEVLVRCQGVRFAYQPEVEVLKGVDIELRAGEVLVLVGPNGSGKTTLARHLNGLLSQTEGTVHVGGRDAKDSTVVDLSRQVALLTQNPGDYLFERSVESELRLTASYRGLDRDTAEVEIAQAVEKLGLEQYMERFSWDLSAGQRQRVALGALLVGAPRVLILDEPTRGMDTAHKASLAGMLRDLVAEGKAVMVITHDQEFAARVADRYAVLEDGEVTVSGAPWEVFLARPEYAPVLWRATEGLDLPLADRPMVPADVIIGDGRSGGGGAW
jgi:energy-coupling factor transport system ATP-binding protein